MKNNISCADLTSTSPFSLYFAIQASGLSGQLDRCSLPALVVTGDIDKIVPTEQSIHLADELPIATLVVIHQAGHVPHEEQPALFI